MRIPLPEKIRFKYAVIFAVVLVIVQQFEHTDPVYSALSFIYPLVFVLAFNAAGGMIYPSGNWIFFNGVLGVSFGIVFKAVLGEPGHTNMEDPVGTLAVDCVATVMFGLMGALCRRLAPKKPLITSGMGLDTMKKAAIGCCILGLVLTVTCWQTLGDEGSIKSALRQINHFSEMAILFATFYEVKKSGGRKSTDWIVWVSGMVVLVSGVLYFSKQGMLSGPFIWLIAGVVGGHNFSRKQILGIVLGFVLFQQFLVPYSQIARNYRSLDSKFSEDAATAVQYLTHIKETRQDFRDDEIAAADNEDVHGLYDTPEGFFDRLCMLKADDDLVAYTNSGHVEGMLPIYYEFATMIPHFLWKNKPDFKVGNMYAHQLGYLADDDDTTGVSFTPQADAYHQATWFGLLVLLPAVVLPLFLIMDSVSGDVRLAPWGVLYIVTVAHTAPEGLMTGIMYAGSVLTETIVIVALASKYILPIFAGVITNTERTRVLRTRDFAPIRVGRGPRPLENDRPHPEVP